VPAPASTYNPLQAIKTERRASFYLRTSSPFLAAQAATWAQDSASLPVRSVDLFRSAVGKFLKLRCETHHLIGMVLFDLRAISSLHILKC
jgi:hypothetical protein